MGKTITTKIIEKAVGREVEIGEFERLDLDIIVLDNWRNELEEIVRLGCEVFDPEKIKIILGGHDYCRPRNIKKRHSGIRAAKKLKIPRKNIFDIGGGGEEHDISIEQGWPLPGSIYLCGIDGQAPINGAMGCIAEPLSLGAGEVVAAMITGKSWIHVVPSMKINLTGELGSGISVRDVFEWILRKIGPTGALGTMIEWTGSFVEKMSISSRLALVGNSAFTGAFSGIINPDNKTIDYIKARTDVSFEPLVSDDDASYKKIIEFDVSSIDPQVVLPPKRHTVENIKNVQGIRIDRGFIGSCANGRLEDLRVVAELLKGRRIHPEVQLNITPNTVENFKLANKEGLIDIFIEAGALVPAPSCSMCAGYITPLVEDEVCLSTSPCNYPGRMGSEKAQIYLASPYTVAVSCLEGKLTDPRNYV